MSTTTEFKVYPNGFFGSTECQAVARVVQSVDYSLYVSRRARDKVEFVVANKDVDKAYHAVVRKESHVNNLEFRLETLAVIAKAFGTGCFETWHAAQHASPLFGENAQRFLDDCLSFIMTGKRELHPITWASLVGGEESDQSQAVLSEVAKSYFGKTSLLPIKGGDTCVKRALVKWCSHPGGFEDLVISAHLFFGISN